MEKALYRLLNEERVRDFVLRGQKVHMVLLSAAELLELRAKESAEEGGDAFADGVHGCAALAARCLCIRGTPVFQSAQEVLQTLSAEEINAVAAAYSTWSREIDPGFDCGERSAEALKKFEARAGRGCGGVCSNSLVFYPGKTGKTHDAAGTAVLRFAAAAGW